MDDQSAEPAAPEVALEPTAGAAAVSPETQPGTAEYRYKRLLDVTCRLNQEHDVDVLLHLLAEAAADLTNADRASIFLVETSHDQLEARVALKTDHPLRVRLGEGIVGHVCQAGRPVTLENAYDDSRFNPEVDRLTGYRTASMACVPIRHLYRTPIGAFQVLNKREGFFDSADVDILLALGANAAVALDGAQAWLERERVIDMLAETKRELVERVGRLDILYTLETAIHEQADPTEFLRTVIYELARVFGVEAASVLLPCNGQDVLHFLAASGPHSDAIRQVALLPGEGIVSHVHRTGEAVLANAPGDDPRFSKRIPAMLGYQVRNVLCVPIVASDQRLGSLEFCNRIEGDFSEDDLRNAILIGRNVGVGLARQAELRARDSRARMETLGLLVQGIAHDLRSPLGGIVQAVSMLKGPSDSSGATPGEQPVPAAVRNRALGIVERQAKRCLAMTEDVLDYSRNTFGYNFEQVRPSELIEELRETIQLELDTRGIALVAEIDGEFEVRVDRWRVCRVFTNLATNACRAIGRGGRISVRVARRNGEATFTFEDTGHGVPAELRPRLFEPFVSGSRSTGLGLSVSRRIVEDHGGRVWLDEAFGPGARFVVALPLNQPAAG
jgi:signal transduction histidine kinase/uncharacterized protein YigA (DUF484 family)